MNIKDLKGNFKVVTPGTTGQAVKPVINIKDLKGKFRVVPGGKKPAAKAPKPENPNGIDSFGKTMQNTAGMFTDAAKGTGEAFQQRGQNITKDIQQTADTVAQETPGKIDDFGTVVKKTGALLETGFNTAGQVAGGAWDIINSALKPALDKISSVPVVQDIAVKDQAHVIDAYDNLTKKIGEISQAHPEAAKTIGNLLNILFTVGGPKAEPKVAETAFKGADKTAEMLSKPFKVVGQVVEDSGAKGLAKEKAAFTDELVQPRDTVKAKEKAMPRSTTEGKGIFKKNVTELSTPEAKASAEVQKLEGVSPKKSLHENYQVIRDENIKEAENLKTQLKANDRVYSKDGLKAKLDTAAEKFKESPTLVGDAESSAMKMVNYAKKLIDESKNNLGSSILDIRKEFDSWVESQKGVGVFDPARENSWSVSTRAIRTTLNDYIKDTFKDSGVDYGSSMAKQTSLYDAMENVAPKAAREAETAVGRFMQKIRDKVTLKNAVEADIFLRLPKSVQLATEVMVGGGYLLYKGGSFFLRPQLRVSLGKLMKSFGDLLSPEEKSVIQQIIKPNVKVKPLELPAGKPLGSPENPHIMPEFKGVDKGGVTVESKRPPTSFDEAMKIKNDKPRYGSLKEYNDAVSNAKKATGNVKGSKPRVDQFYQKGKAFSKDVIGAKNSLLKEVADGGDISNTMKMYDNYIKDGDIQASDVYSDAKNKIFTEKTAGRVVEDAKNLLIEQGYPDLAEKLVQSVDLKSLTPEKMRAAFTKVVKVN